MDKGRLEPPSTSEDPIRGTTRVAVARLAALTKNPLVIALAVVLLGNFLIPRILDRTETNRRALDLKANLATEMSGSFAAVLTQGELFAKGMITKTDVDSQGAFNEAWREWRNASAGVDAKLTAYFPGSRTFTDRWDQYQDAVGAMYFLSGTDLKADRCGHIEVVKAVVGPSNLLPVSCRDPSDLGDETFQQANCLDQATGTYNLLAACDSDNEDVSGYQRGPRFATAYLVVSKTLLELGESLVRELVRLTPSGF